MNVLVNVPENIDFYSGYVHVHVYEHVHVEFCLASLGSGAIAPFLAKPSVSEVLHHFQSSFKRTAHSLLIDL